MRVFDLYPPLIDARKNVPPKRGKIGGAPLRFDPPPFKQRLFVRPYKFCAQYARGKLIRLLVTLLVTIRDATTDH
jgi:hypothetical protein